MIVQLNCDNWEAVESEWVEENFSMCQEINGYVLQMEMFVDKIF